MVDLQFQPVQFVTVCSHSCSCMAQIAAILSQQRGVFMLIHQVGVSVDGGRIHWSSRLNDVHFG